MNETTVQLGDFVFEDFEIPEQIPWGSEQSLQITRQVGGSKTIDAMGPDDLPLVWSGRFRGPNALDRALQLNAMTKAGQPLILTWSALSYTVVIQRFVCPFLRVYELPYTITCEVLQDNTAPILASQEPSLDDQVGADLSDAMSLAGGIGDPTLSSNLSAVASAISAAGTLAGATQSAIGSVLAPVAAALTQATALVATNNAVVESVSTFGGMVAGGNPATLAASLTAQGSAMSALVALSTVSSLLGRISINLQSVPASGPTITMGGGNLYQVASQQYGNPAEWVTVAEANGISDPMLSGINTLLIPATPSGTDGVFPT